MYKNIKNLLLTNFKEYLNILLLSLICTAMHVFVCNYGGISNYILSQNNNINDRIFDVIICVVILSFALSILFSINIFISKFFVFICNFIGAIYTYFVCYQGIIINEQIVISAIFFPEANDYSSAFDFMVFIYVILITLISCVTIFYFEKKLKVKSIFTAYPKKLLQIIIKKMLQFFIALILIISLLAPFYKHVFILTYKLKTISEQMMPSYLFAQYKEIILMHKSSQNFDLKGYEDYDFQFVNSLNKSPVIAVIVIGESLRSDRLSLNNYHRNTNPLLSKVPNLLTFKDVLSCATTTSASLLCMLTDEEQDQWPNKFYSANYEKKYSVSKILKDLGFDVVLLSTANKDSSIYVYKDFHAPNKVIMASELRKKYMSKYNDYGDLLLLEEVNVNIDKNTLYVLGTRGNHREYYMNYSRKFAKFQPDIGHSIEEINNSYDNAVLYFDNFMSELINKLKYHNSIIYYVSDHGESLGENNIFLHGAKIEDAPKEQRMVPMMIWMSDEYIKNNKQKFLNLKNKNIANRNDKLNLKHDHFFPTILGCLNIKSKKTNNLEKLNLCN